MDTRFKDIKVLIWDFDGTLYDFKKYPEIPKEIIEADYLVVRKHTGWDRQKTILEFNKIYGVKTTSMTKTAALLTGLTTLEVAIECEQYKDRTKYLKQDEKLVRLFTQLSSFIHIMLVNGIIEKTTEAIRVLGIDPAIFKEIVTSETVGVNKPDEKGLRYILDKTKLPLEAHLMIGDRETVDLLPAKNLGMKTCLVWSDKNSSIADITLKMVYEVSALFS